MFKKKEKIKAQVIEEITPVPSITPNGHGDKSDKIASAINKLRESGALQKFEEQMNYQNEEKTKYTVLHDLSSTEPDKIKMHTELTEEEIYIINKLYMAKQMLPMVFGNSDTTKKVMSIVDEHIREHRLNKMSFRRNRELSLIHAVRGDNTVTQTESQLQKVFKYK